jgi:hypothetical protein
MAEPPKMAEERVEMGPAMSTAVGPSPRRRAVAQAMRGGKMAF